MPTVNYTVDILYFDTCFNDVHSLKMINDQMSIQSHTFTAFIYYRDAPEDGTVSTP